MNDIRTALIPWYLKTLPPTNEFIYSCVTSVPRRIFFGPHLTDFDSESIRYIYYDDFNLENLLSKLEYEDIDIFVNYCVNTNITNVKVLKMIKVALVSDTHLSFFSCSLRRYVEYFKKEQYDYVFTLSSFEHGHFFSELGIKVFPYPRAGLSKETVDSLCKQKRVFNVTFIGHRASLVQLRPTRMLRYLKKELKLKNIRFNFFKHCDFNTYTNIISKSKIYICCTSNSQFTPQIYLSMQLGALCLVDRLSKQSGVYKLFKDGEHFVVWDSFSDLVDKIVYYTKNSYEAEKIAKKGQERALKLFPYNNEIVGINQIVKGEKVLIESGFDPRSIYSKSEEGKELSRRLNFYENMQELHRRNENIKICFFTRNLKYISDVADMPRLDVYLSYQEINERETNEFLERNKVAENIKPYTFNLNVSFDIVIMEVNENFKNNIIEIRKKMNKKSLLFILGEIDEQLIDFLRTKGFKKLHYSNIKISFFKKLINKIFSIEFVYNKRSIYFPLVADLHCYCYKR